MTTVADAQYNGSTAAPLDSTTGMKHRSISSPKIATCLLPVWLALAGVTLALTGCFPIAVPDYPAPDLTSALPSSWTPVMFDARGRLWRGTPWNEIDIDGDAAQEYLLFFTYDNGQVGAAIFDLQIGANRLLPTPVPQPNEPPGTYRPYRFAPDFFACGGSVGYIAPPGAQASDLNFRQVQRSTPDTTDSGLTIGAELYIIGSNKVLTVAWWQGERFGYGVTQVAAGYQLVQPVYAGDGDASPIESIIGLDPRGAYDGKPGRSLLCRASLYKRLLYEGSPDCGPQELKRVGYVDDDLGIVFCSPAPPSAPYYPDGTVLAFLKPENYGNLDMTDDEMTQYRLDFMTQTVAGPAPETYLPLVSFDEPDGSSSPAVIVRELEYTGTVPATAQQWVAQGGVVTTKVCARIASQLQNDQRLLLFDLLYQPPYQVTQDDATTLTAGRWRISGITDASGRAPNCTTLFQKLSGH